MQAYSDECKAKWAAETQARLEKRAEQLGCPGNVKLVQYIEALEHRFDRLVERLGASKQAWVLADPPIKETADDPRTARAARRVRGYLWVFTKDAWKFALGTSVQLVDWSRLIEWFKAPTGECCISQ